MMEEVTFSSDDETENISDVSENEAEEEDRRMLLKQKITELKSHRHFQYRLFGGLIFAFAALGIGAGFGWFFLFDACRHRDREREQHLPVKHFGQSVLFPRYHEGEMENSFSSFLTLLQNYSYTWDVTLLIKYKFIHDQLSVYNYSNCSLTSETENKIILLQMIIEKTMSLLIFNDNNRNLLNTYITLKANPLGNERLFSGSVRFVRRQTKNNDVLQVSLKNIYDHLVKLDKETTVMYKLRSKFFPFVSYGLYFNTSDLIVSQELFRFVPPFLNREQVFWYYYFGLVSSPVTTFEKNISFCLEVFPVHKRNVSVVGLIGECNISSAFLETLYGYIATKEHSRYFSEVIFDEFTLNVFIQSFFSDKNNILNDVYYFFLHKRGQHKNVDLIRKLILSVVDIYCGQYLFPLFDIYFFTFSSKFTSVINSVESVLTKTVKNGIDRAETVDNLKNIYDTITNSSFTIPNTNNLVVNVQNCFRFYNAFERALLLSPLPPPPLKKTKSNGK